MLSLIDDLIGAVYDVGEGLLGGLGYFLAGVLLVSVPLHLLAYAFEWIAKLMVIWEFYR